MTRIKSNTISLNPTAHIFNQIADFTKTGASFVGQKIKNPLRNLKIPNFNFKNVDKKYLAAGVIGLLVVAGFGLYLAKSGNSASEVASVKTTSSAPSSINKKLSIPIREQSGKETGKQLIVNFTNVERSEELLYKGRPLLPRDGKDFAVINIEIENSTNDRLTVRPADFVRLVDSEKRNYAPDIQTDPIKVEPLSIKRTRTVFIISDDQKNIKFLIGEINGNKETVEIKI